MGIAVQSLLSLGLNAYEAAAYMSLIGRPELSPAEIARRARIPRQRVYDILDSLVFKGLCVLKNAAPKTYSGTDPNIALDLLAQEQATALEHQRKEILELAPRVAAELRPIFTSGRDQTDPLAYVEVLSGTTRIAQRALALAHAAKRTINSCIRPPMILSQEQNWAFLKTPLGRGLTYRALCASDALKDADMRNWLPQLREGGLDTRLTPELPLKMQSFDNETALISMQDPTAGQPSFTAVVIHNRGLVAMLNIAFEHLWESATPLNEQIGTKE
jgi:HTH-type transcriptional regulator, sugar sensing transcriptional regulator